MKKLVYIAIRAARPQLSVANHCVVWTILEISACHKTFYSQTRQGLSITSDELHSLLFSLHNYASTFLSNHRRFIYLVGCFAQQALIVTNNASHSQKNVSSWEAEPNWVSITACCCVKQDPFSEYAVMATKHNGCTNKNIIASTKMRLIHQQTEVKKSRSIHCQIRNASTQAYWSQSKIKNRVVLSRRPESTS